MLLLLLVLSVLNCPDLVRNRMIAIAEGLKLNTIAVHAIRG